MADSKSAVMEPDVDSQVTRREQRQKSTQRTPPKQQPRYHVVLWDDSDHTYDYVIDMLKELFAYTPERAFKLAETVDTQGRAVCLTTTKEHAELKRDQIHAYGRDQRMQRSAGSMSASIEPDR